MPADVVAIAELIGWFAADMLVIGALSLLVLLLATWPRRRAYNRGLLARASRPMLRLLPGVEPAEPSLPEWSGVRSSQL